MKTRLFIEVESSDEAATALINFVKQIDSLAKDGKSGLLSFYVDGDYSFKIAQQKLKPELEEELTEEDKKAVIDILKLISAFGVKGDYGRLQELAASITDRWQTKHPEEFKKILDEVNKITENDHKEDTND